MENIEKLFANLKNIDFIGELLTGEESALGVVREAESSLETIKSQLIQDDKTKTADSDPVQVEGLEGEQ